MINYKLLIKKNAFQFYLKIWSINLWINPIIRLSIIHDIDNICFVRCHFPIKGLNRKHRSQSSEITAAFRDKDKLLWELILKTSPYRFASHLRNAEMPTRFVMQKRRRESSGHSQLWSGTAFPAFPRCFPGFSASRVWGDGNFRTVKKSVLSARLDSFEKPMIIKRRRIPVS